MYSRNMGVAFPVAALIVYVCVSCFVVPSSAQIPRVCKDNATKADAVCCPTPPGFTRACGSWWMGTCKEADTRAVPAQTPIQARQDDRLQWPTRFFTWSCKCRDKFTGPDCTKCKPGYTGPTCDIKVNKIRRNIRNMTSAEKRRFAEIVNASKYIMADNLVVNVANNEFGDPATPEKLIFHEVSVYDYMVYIHLYASRSTLVDPVMETCNPLTQTLNFAHKGPAFLPWHRKYLLEFEDQLARIAQTRFAQLDFALPYWDWVGKTTCEPCTEDLFGDFAWKPGMNITLLNVTMGGTLFDEDAVDETSVYSSYGISTNSTFSNWVPMCPQAPSIATACHVCDPDEVQPKLWRAYSSVPEFQRLPSQVEVDLMMNIIQYDTEPYDENSGNASFRNALEGFAWLAGPVSPQNVYMHNLVHSFLNGTWFDTATSPNDPIFLLHHTFVDKLYELFLRQRDAWSTYTIYPRVETMKLGHGPEDYLVPFFPPEKVKDYFKWSEDLGYDYDDNFAGSTLIATVKKPIFYFGAQQGNVLTRNSGATAAVVLACTLALVCLVALAVYKYRQRKATGSLYQYVDSNPSYGMTDKTPILVECSAQSPQTPPKGSKRFASMKATNAV